jgi:integrase
MAGARALSHPESDALIGALRCDRDRLLVLAGQHLGLRISELLSLTVGMVANGLTPRSEITIPRRNFKGSKRYRGIHGRTIPTHSDLRSALAFWLANFPGGQPAPNQFLFPSRKGSNQPIGPRQAWCAIKTAALAAGLDASRISTHSLRKTFARELYELSGHDIRACQVCLGHADGDLRSTVRYLEPDAKRCADLVRSLPSRLTPAMGTRSQGPLPTAQAEPAALTS